MKNLDDLLGVDPNDPLAKLAYALVSGDHEFMRTLVRRRLHMGMTREQVAEKMDLSPEQVHETIEAYYADPPLSLIRRYAMAINAMVTHQVTDPGL